MILADKTIREQSTRPPFVLTHRGVTNLTHHTVEEMEENNAGFPVDSQFHMHYRPATDEDLANWTPMISPFIDGQVRQRGGALTNPPPDFVQDENDFEMRSWRTPVEKIISYGLSSYGYDVRLANKFKIFTNVNSSIIDPLTPDDRCFAEVEVDENGFCILPPNSYLLGHTIETFAIPRNVTAVCVGKSTYARCGAIINVTPIEAGFKGQVVIEISNATNLPLKIYAGMGIAQFLFFLGNLPCEVSYADRNGKYQNQTGIQGALV